MSESICIWLCLLDTVNTTPDTSKKPKGTQLTHFLTFEVTGKVNSYADMNV